MRGTWLRRSGEKLEVFILPKQRFRPPRKHQTQVTNRCLKYQEPNLDLTENERMDLVWMTVNGLRF